MTGYFLALKRSPLKWWLPLLLAIDLLTLFGRGRWWIGVWPQAGAAAQVPAAFLGPAMAGAAAWAAGAPSRRGLVTMRSVSPRPLWQAETAELSAALTFGLGTYFAGMIAATAVSWPAAGPGLPWPGYLLVGAAVIIACTSVGHLAGRVSNSPMTTPIICLLGTFVLISTLGGDETLGLNILSGDPQLAVTASAATARILLAAAVALVAIQASGWRLGATKWRPTPTRQVFLVLSSLSAVAAVAFIAMAGPLRVERPAPATPLCTTTAPRICLWPEERKYLTPLTAVAQRLAALPPGTVTVPATFYEKGLRQGPDTNNDFRIIEGSLWAVSPSIAGSVIEKTFPTYCDAATTQADNRRTLAYFELASWLEARANGSGQPADVHGGPPGVDLGVIGALLTKSDTAQAAWAKQRIDIIRGTPCG